MSVIKGDFLGFTFDGVHSSELGITRVSDGSRYTDNLLPTIQDKTIQIPGADGTYYYGSYYTQRQFNFPIAFDNLSEEQLRRLKALFSDKKVHDLIFDELPYKVYKVKANGTPNLKYVCFDKKSNTILRDGEIDVGMKSKDNLYGVGGKVTYGRVYRGEGQLSFVAYSPFARCRYKYLNEYVFTNVPEWGPMDFNDANNVYYNLYDWADTSRLVLSTTKKKHDKVAYVIDRVNPNGIMVYNPGDMPVHFSLDFYFIGEIKQCAIGPFGEKSLEFKGLKLFEGDSGIRINGSLNLIEGIDADGKATGTIYNKYLVAGDFFKIEPTVDLTWLPITWDADCAPAEFRGNIDYKYLYY